jgi:hypothetical protein
MAGKNHLINDLQMYFGHTGRFLYIGKGESSEIRYSFLHRLEDARRVGTSHSRQALEWAVQDIMWDAIGARGGELTRLNSL